MSETIREEGGEGGFKYGLKVSALVEAVLDPDREAMFFLGAGASLSSEGESLPSGRALAQELAAECRLDWNEYVPLSTVAFYYESIFGRARLNRFLSEKILRPDVPPSRTVTALVDIIQRLEAKGISTLIVTTNYDQKLEEAYEQKLGRRPQVVVFRGATDPNDLTASLHDGLGKYYNRPQDWQPDQHHRTYIYKMHGCISQAQGDPASLVITEEDYINFLANSMSHAEKKQILRYVRGRIALSTVIFIGYSLSDWNFRVIYKATAETNRDHGAFAIQRHRLAAKPNTTKEQTQMDAFKWENLIEFWGRKNVSILNVDAAVFMGDFHTALVQRLDGNQPPV